MKKEIKKEENIEKPCNQFNIYLLEKYVFYIAEPKQEEAS